MLPFGYNETQLLSSLAGYFRSLYETSLCKGGDKEVAAALGVSEFIARKNREQAVKFGKDRLLQLYNAVYGAVSAIKCGELTPSSALNMTTARLFFENS